MPYVRYRYLEEEGIVTDRVALARAIERYGFPKPLAMGANTLAWDLTEIQDWLASRPRIIPKAGFSKGRKPLPAIIEEADRSPCPS